MDRRMDRRKLPTGVTDGSYRRRLPTEVTDGRTEGRQFAKYKRTGVPTFSFYFMVHTMPRIRKQTEAEVVFQHNMKLLSDAVQLLVAQNSTELHYYKNYDFTTRYTVALDEKTIPDYMEPVYNVRGHTRVVNEHGRRTIYYCCDFYHFEHGYLKKDFDEMGSQFVECRLISGKEIQDKRYENPLAASLAREVSEYRLKKKI